MGRVKRLAVEDVGGSRIRVGGPQAHHALRVLRLRVGDEVVLTDGKGSEARGRIVSVEREALEVAVEGRRASESSTVRLTLCVATPKGPRADWMVEKCAELGVEALCPVLWERGVVRPGAEKVRRWERKAAEACKQSGQSRAMRIEEPQRLGALMGRVGGGAACVADPTEGLRMVGEWMREVIGARAASVVMAFVGPEGGITAKEMESLRSAGATAVRLAGPTLRIETAAIVVAASWGGVRGG